MKINKSLIASFVLCGIITTSNLNATTTTNTKITPATATNPKTETTTSSSTKPTQAGVQQSLNTSVSKTKLKAPLLNLYSSTEWSLFLREFEMKMNIGTCCRKGDIASCAIGFAAKMIEPIGYMETTQKPLKFPFANIDLGGNIAKSGALNQFSNNTSAIRSAIAYAHFIYVPVMGMIFKKSLKFVCLHSGDIVIPYISEFDPMWSKDIYYSKMIPHYTGLFSPQGLITSLIDCVSTEIVNTMIGYSNGSQSVDLNNMDSFETTSSTHAERDSSHRSTLANKSIDSLNSIRNTLYFIDGCSGFTPIGGYVNGEDIVTDASLTFHGIMAMLHGVSAMSPIPFLYKQSNALVDSKHLPPKARGGGGLDTMCTWKKYPLPIPSQYALQLSYPVVSTAKEAGSSGITVSLAKNVPGAANAVVYTIWERRDYYAFAYFCGNK